jgi:Holliday junction resolvase RusA-like endonuclease
MTTTIRIPGVPRTKGSTRSFLSKGRIVTTSDNVNLKSWEHTVRVCALEAGMHPTAGSAHVTVHFHMPRPKSHFRTNGEVKGNCEHWPHAKKPDLDKLARAILDGLDGVVYHDDAQVCSLHALKTYTQHPEHWIGAVVIVEQED